MQEINAGNSDSNATIWENNPIEDYIKGSLVPVDEYELMKFNRKVLEHITFDIDKETGAVVHKYFEWGEIGKVMMEEIAIYVKAKKPPNVNPIENIKEGIEARRRTRVLKEFYLKYIQSGKYQVELIKACEKKKDPDEVNDAILRYLKMLRSELNRNLERRK